MQKLVTIALSASDGKQFHAHGTVQEHLSEYLESGWQIRSVNATGAGTEMLYYCWVIVELVKDGA